MIRRSLQLTTLFLGIAMSQMTCGQTAGDSEHTGCDGLNGIYESEVVVEFENFQKQPSLTPKPGDKFNFLVWSFYPKLSLNDLPSRFKLNFDEKLGELDIGGEYPPEGKVKPPLHETYKAACINGYIILDEDESGQSDGSRYRMHAKRMLHVNDGELIYEWHIETTTWLIFIPETTITDGRGKMRRLQ